MIPFTSEASLDPPKWIDSTEPYAGYETVCVVKSPYQAKPLHAKPIQEARQRIYPSYPRTDTSDQVAVDVTFKAANMC